MKFFMNIQPLDKSLIPFGSGDILGIFELRIAIDHLILLVSAFDKIKSISPEYPIKFRIDNRVYVFFEILLQNLWDEVNHRLEEILVFEYKFRFAVAKQDAHIDVTYLLAFLLQLMRLVDHQTPWFHLVFRAVFAIPYLELLQHHHVLKYFT